MLIVIVGKSGSGKGLFARHLSEMGIEEILTYTERPPRHELDNHIFATKEDYDNCIDIIAETKYGDHHYWLRLKQIDWSRPQCVTLDVDGLEHIRNNGRLSALRVEAVCINTSFFNRYGRLYRDYFRESRDSIVADQKAMERMDRDKGFELIPKVTVIDNNGTEEELKALAKKFYDTIV